MVRVSQDFCLCCSHTCNGGLCGFSNGLHKQLMIPSLHALETCQTDLRCALSTFEFAMRHAAGCFPDSACHLAVSATTEQPDVPYDTGHFLKSPAGWIWLKIPNHGGIRNCIMTGDSCTGLFAGWQSYKDPCYEHPGKTPDASHAGSGGQFIMRGKHCTGMCAARQP